MKERHELCTERDEPKERWSLETQGKWGDEDRRGRGEDTSRSRQGEQIRKKPEG